MNQPPALSQRQIESACRHYQSVLKAQRTFYSNNKEVIKEKRRQRYASQKLALGDASGVPEKDTIAAVQPSLMSGVSPESCV